MSAVDSIRRSSMDCDRPVLIYSAMIKVWGSPLVVSFLVLISLCCYVLCLNADSVRRLAGKLIGTTLQYLTKEALAELLRFVSAVSSLSCLILISMGCVGRICYRTCPTTGKNGMVM